MSAIYKYLFKTCDETPTDLGWGTREDQTYRFNKMCQVGIIDDPKSSILDVGCGYGDFLNYLANVIGNEFYYKGIDLRPEAIAIAKKNHPNKDFAIGSIYDENKSYDWVVGSGIFCIEYPDWVIHTSNTISSMYNLCNKGVAVNFLPKIAGKNDMLRKTNLEELYNGILKNNYDKFNLLYDKESYDITMYLYKKGINQ
jgi:SAM-dependent methyltransferase